jgi:hypothetical protein
MKLDETEVDVALPRRRMRVDELAAFLLHPDVTSEIRDAVWRVVVERARIDKDWALAAAGMHMPALRTVSRMLMRGFEGNPADLEQAILLGFYRGLHAIDLTRSYIAYRLRSAARDAGLELRIDEGMVPVDPREMEERSMPPRLPWRHPEMVLIDAVAKNIVSEDDAELIAVTRLEHVPVVELAKRLHVSDYALYHRRSRAEQRLVQAIAEGDVRACVDPPAA